ncbi:hypothetical protein HDV57DRAFT_407028 [Trichoderma longibrachiatum]|uniref:Uncharacterized protein n=1 Tax=Trichoderma longibrachiatum ATCC 18648 TaxID=983965 RepID=A0A2T4C271_TRILO|nr:hypothetical protein M440DRAFT_1470638 [Trichoderma longibrachiatum ATCC 18648]
MARDQLHVFSRRSSRSSRHSSRPKKTCNAPDCHRERISKSHDGETKNSKFCHRHSCSLSPSLGLCCAEKRSSDVFCHEHSTCLVEGCKSRIDQSSSRRLCLQHNCRIQNCNDRVDAPSLNFCWEHDRAVFDSLWLPHILPVAVYATPSPSPSPPPSSSCRLSMGEELVDSVTSSAGSVVVSPASTAPSVKDEPRTHIQDGPVDAVTDVPVAAPVGQTLEVKTDIASPVIEGDKARWSEEEESLPAFFSGVGVGLCILLQIIYAIVQLLLELVRGSKRGW